jgi:putative hydrolase of the HAD superfamily
LKDKNTVGHVLFDLDETVYPKDTGLMELVSQRISDYMTLRLGIDPETVHQLRRQYYERYGTTGRGLFLHHRDLDVEDYFFFVHDLPIEEFLQPNRRLDEMLEALEAEKAIFTNATAEHARRVLRALTIDEHFQTIIDIRELEYVPKPNPEAYRKALTLLKARPEECLLVEDRVRNLAPGKELGMMTVLVGNQRVAEDADFIVADVTAVGEVVERIRSGHGQ